MQAPALKSIVTDCYDFPKPGIVFKDITPLLQHPELCAEIVTYMRFQLKGIQIDAIAGI